MYRFVLLLFVFVAASAPTLAQDADTKPQTLFTNVHVFDGKNEQRIENANVLVEGNLIKTVSTDPIEAEGATVIDGGGRTLMPGLIDAHVHLYWNVPVSELFALPQDYLYALTLKEGEATLMRGYTTVRDISGSVFGVKRAFDEGLYPGPRIYASGPGISMTAGHADFRTNTTAPRILGGPPWGDTEFSGMAVLADGVPVVLGAARLSMRKGAHFLKMYTSGAVSGLYDPLDIGEFSFDEIKAAADEAKRWNKQYNAKIAVGTDFVGVASEKYKQAFELTNRLKWFTPFEILNQALVNNAELLSWTGPRNPYPGKLGVIEEGAYADILLVNGNPLEDLTLFNKPEENLALIMKDGKVYKNTLDQ